tara:strand:- start:2522 stop:2683 length:162 start_codon:yes stop_codon:yes gene_type:complete
MNTYESTLAHYVRLGMSAACAEAKLWASFSRSHSLSQISKDVDAAIAAKTSEC